VGQMMVLSAALDAMPQATSYEVQTRLIPIFRTRQPGDLSRELPRRFIAYHAIRPVLPRARDHALYAPGCRLLERRGPRSFAAACPGLHPLTQRRIEWEPVRGAQQYIVRVTTVDEAGGEHAEEVAMRDTGCVVADQHATYHVRAFRRPNDDRTASEWSDGVTLSPKESAAPGFSLQRSVGFVGNCIAAVLVGIALGWRG